MQSRGRVRNELALPLCSKTRKSAENRAEIGFPCGFPYGFPGAEMEGANERATLGLAIRQRTVRKSVPCTALWTVLYSARTEVPLRQTKCEKKRPRNWTRAKHSKGRERPPFLAALRPRALRASGVAPALRRVQNVVRAVLPASIGTNPKSFPAKIPPTEQIFFSSPD